MTSPYPLDVSVQMFYDGTWNVITSDVRQTSDITMRWGRDDEASVASPNELGLLLNNARSKISPTVFGRYSPRNPRSDLYGKISRNTPVRVRLGDANAHMALTGTQESYASTPDVSALDVTGDIDIRLDIEPTTWRPAAVTALARKYVSTGNQRAWAWHLNPAGTMTFYWSPDGTLASRVLVISAAVPSTPGRLAVRVTVDVNNGAGGNTVTFYTAPTLGGSWTQLGSSFVGAGVTSVFGGTADVEVGRINPGGIASDPLEGKVYAFQLRNGIGGTVVANPDFGAQDASAGPVTFTDSASRVWTVSQLACIDDTSIRMVGETTNLPVEWDITGSDVHIPLRAKSITRRLGQGAPALRSSLYRDLSNNTEVAAYWPMEDSSEATQLASGKAGHGPLTVEGDVNVSAYNGFAGSESVPTFGNIAHAFGTVPRYTSRVRQRWSALIHQSSSQPADRNLIYTTCAGGGITEAILVLKSDGSLRFVLRDFTGTNVVDSASGVGDLRDKNALVWMVLEQVGTTIEWQAGAIIEGDDFGSVFSGSLAAFNWGRFTTVRVGAAGELSGCAIGHLNLISSTDDSGFWSTITTSLIGWAGETAGNRQIRLCAEEGVPLVFVGDPDDTVPMGKQGTSSLLALLNECADADMGALDDHTRILARRYRTRTSLYRQSVALTLDYPSGEVAHPLSPTSDDQALRNDVTVVRQDGSSARSVQETGPNNVQDPTVDPQGVGRYDVSLTLNVADDSQLADQAGWRRALGTVDEDRYPSVRAHLGRDPHLTDSVRTLAPGSRVQITNPPEWLPGESIDQLVQGGTEKLSSHNHEIELTCTPAAPWDVVSVSSGSDEMRVDTGGSTTSGSFVAGTGTSMSVASVAGLLWTTNATMFPFDIAVAGVVLEVTNITGASSPQTFTITAAPVNGVTKTIPSGSDVRLAEPPIIGL